MFTHRPYLFQEPCAKESASFGVSVFPTTHHRPCERTGKPIERWGRKATGPPAENARVAGLPNSSEVLRQPGLIKPGCLFLMLHKGGEAQHMVKSGAPDRPPII